MTTIGDAKNLPYSEESERAVLAAVLLDSEHQLASTASRLVKDDFYLERHQRLYQSMLDLQSSGTDIDLRTLQARLEQTQQLELVGGLSYLATLDVDLPDLSRVDNYVEIIKERSLRRRLIAACTDVYRDCFDGGADAKEAWPRPRSAFSSSDRKPSAVASSRSRTPFVTSLPISRPEVTRSFRAYPPASSTSIE